jgi:hypothetical protein
MRLLAGFALVLVGIAFVQGQLVVPQINNLNAVISLLPQFQVNESFSSINIQTELLYLFLRVLLVNWIKFFHNLLAFSHLLNYNPLKIKLLKLLQVNLEVILILMQSKTNYDQFSNNSLDRNHKTGQLLMSFSNKLLMLPFLLYLAWFLVSSANVKQLTLVLVLVIFLH